MRIHTQLSTIVTTLYPTMAILLSAACGSIGGILSNNVTIGLITTVITSALFFVFIDENNVIAHFEHRTDEQNG